MHRYGVYFVLRYYTVIHTWVIAKIYLYSGNALELGHFWIPGYHRRSSAAVRTRLSDRYSTIRLQLGNFSRSHWRKIWSQSSDGMFTSVRHSQQQPRLTVPRVPGLDGSRIGCESCDWLAKGSKLEVSLYTPRTWLDCCSRIRTIIVLSRKKQRTRFIHRSQRKASAIDDFGRQTLNLTQPRPAKTAITIRRGGTPKVAPPLNGKRKAEPGGGPSFQVRPNNCVAGFLVTVGFARNGGKKKSIKPHPRRHRFPILFPHHTPFTYHQFGP